MYKVVLIALITFFISPRFLICQYGAEMDKIIENGFEIIIGDVHQSDTINLSDIISGSDKSSFFIDQYGDTINHYSLKK